MNHWLCVKGGSFPDIFQPLRFLGRSYFYITKEACSVSKRNRIWVANSMGPSRLLRQAHTAIPWASNRSLPRMKAWMVYMFNPENCGSRQATMRSIILSGNDGAFLMTILPKNHIATSTKNLDNPHVVSLILTIHTISGIRLLCYCSRENKLSSLVCALIVCVHFQSEKLLPFCVRVMKDWNHHGTMVKEKYRNLELRAYYCLPWLYQEALQGLHLVLQSFNFSRKLSTKTDRSKACWHGGEKPVRLLHLVWLRRDTRAKVSIIDKS